MHVQYIAGMLKPFEEICNLLEKIRRNPILLSDVV